MILKSRRYFDMFDWIVKVILNDEFGTGQVYLKVKSRLHRM